MMIGFALLALLLLGGVVLAIVAGGSGLLQALDRGQTFEEKRSKTPRQVLDQRLARGEIDEDEYEAIRSRIEH